MFFAKAASKSSKKDADAEEEKSTGDNSKDIHKYSGWLDFY